MLRETLQLQPASRGSNVTIAVPAGDSVFFHSSEPAPGIRCTGALQTYLDLSIAGDRGREAADHLRQICLEPQWSSP